MKPVKRLSLLLALCLLLAVVPAAWAEEGEILAAPVDAAVEEVESTDLWTEDIAKAVEEAEAVKQEAAAAPKEDDIPIDEEHFPDKVFRTYISERLDNGDGVLSQAERDAVTSLTIYYGSDTHYNSIKDLQGIEYLTELESLTMTDMGLQTVDVHQNAKLKKINLANNKVSSLNVSGCTELAELYVNKRNNSDPGLTKLDVSHNARLTHLGVRFNSLTSLDLSACPELVELYADRNEISSLDLSGKTKLQTLSCYSNQLTALNLSGCASLSSIDCSRNSIVNLDVGDCASLQTLDCYNNQISGLDVSANGELHRLSCGSNPLTSLRLVSSLQNLYCTNIPLKQLNLYGCPTLIMLSQCTPTRTWSDESQAYWLAYTSESYNLYVDEDMTFVNVDPAPDPIPIADCEITGVKAQTYTGKAIKPNPVVKYDGVKLVKGTDYTVAYKNNKAVGTATVTVKGIGNYTGTAKKAFKINPKKVAVSKLTAGKKKLTVQWKKTAGAGYQIQYGLKKNFSGAKTVTITKTATVKKVLKNLRSGKTYYVRIRGYRKVNGKKYVSAWSKARTAKVK